MRLGILILTVLCVACEIRTSSEKRFETNIGLSLPSDKKVLKDEYQDMMQDYAIIYDIELSSTSSQQLTDKIKTLISTTDNQNCTWHFAENGYSFRCDKDRTTYFVRYDTVRRIINYEEFAD
jgi:hypothetical protein